MTWYSIYGSASQTVSLDPQVCPGTLQHGLLSAKALLWSWPVLPSNKMVPLYYDYFTRAN